MSDLLNSASLVMIPSGYKEDVVYSQIPTDGSGDLAFTRASNGTRINSAGLVEVAPWNMLTYSEEFNNASWSKSNTTVTANAITAPNGTTTADFIVANTSNDLHSIFQSSGITNGKYTISVYAKQGGYKNLLVWFDGHSGGIGVNLDNLTIFRNQNNDGYLIETLANGWYKISVTATISIASLPNFYIYDNSATPQISFAGNGTSGIYLWGAQMNTGTLKPYFPTTDRLNVPRLTYQNGGGGCPSLLLEKQSTNELLYSEDFTNGAWTLDGNGVGESVTANYSISPDGTQNADRLQLNKTGGTYSRIRQTASSGANTYAFTVYMKSNTSASQNVGLRLDTTGINCVVTTSWQRFTLNATVGTPQAQIILFDSITGNDETADISVWGAQLEASSYATSYIPTTSSSATRVADACYKTGISSLIGQTEGVLFADVNWNVKPEAGSPIISILALNNNVANLDNCIILGIERQSGGTNRVYCYVQNSGSTQAGLFGSNISSGRYKIALGYKANDFVLYVNGVQIATDTSGTVPTTSEVLLGIRFQGDSFNLNDTINESVIFKTRLSNSELASLTTL